MPFKLKKQITENRGQWKWTLIDFEVPRESRKQNRRLRLLSILGIVSNVNYSGERFHIHFLIHSSHIWFLYIFTVIHSSLHGFIANQHNDQLPLGSLAQLVGHCTGFKWVQILYRPQLISGLIFTTASAVFINAKIAYIPFLISGSHIRSIFISSSEGTSILQSDWFLTRSVFFLSLPTGNDNGKNNVPNFVGSLLSHLYHYANENVSVKPLSLLCITLF